MSDPAADPPGIDCARVAAWLAPLVGGLAGRLCAELIEGGRSNLTYVIADATRSWVLRRPPLAHVLPTAHDMAREHRVLSALEETDIPVPLTVGLCTDAGVLGVPFYVMERVAGFTIRDTYPDGLPDTAAARAAMSRSLVRTLAALHAVDPEAVGLGQFGKPAGYLERQLRRWWSQWEMSRTRELPAMDALRAALERRLPEQTAAGIVHGDYRLDNVLIGPDDPARIAAILDWEMCTIGDPLADLGLLLVYWADRTDDSRSLAAYALSPITTQPGFLGRDELVAEYARLTPRPLVHLDWYWALGFYKLAIVAEGIHARYVMGMTVGEGFELMGPRVPHLVEQGLERLGAAAPRGGV
jgi:aminoglycoside phosphotransferase (APT) family kinase protein